ncbi:hypothetical protein BB584_10605 [Listeria monocytogenes]|uniref:DUF2481 domain-containing protein n=1 Tax=Listeria monocytogenes TaxID=1639 RepID=A0A843PC16_LISMN|nr:DUF2481 family protein [Listeria monocytogenes]EAA0051962.1 DUF2481 domain-containing protein [Listeria monocytogenes]EAA0148963.1 DUF2481 domain-containing protein [Listeria monocytogenes]EAA0308820.1 DUF2481 domain-containing protein [Listeria monocytogenes]EAA0315000.1 DUF2481 domain-containing protein [Listeria monocytogenes]EAC3346275.1 DUF2481 domain-containing protein [Listeria monocytogenes]
MATNKEKQMKIIQELVKKDLSFSKRKNLLDKLAVLEKQGTEAKMRKRRRTVIQSTICHKDFEKLTIYELINLRNAGLSFTSIAEYFSISTSTLHQFKINFEKTYYRYFKQDKYKANKAANFSWDEKP